MLEHGVDGVEEGEVVLEGGGDVDLSAGWVSVEHPGRGMRVGLPAAVTLELDELRCEVCLVGDAHGVQVLGLKRSEGLERRGIGDRLRVLDVSGGEESGRRNVCETQDQGRIFIETVGLVQICKGFEKLGGGRIGPEDMSSPEIALGKGIQVELSDDAKVVGSAFQCKPEI